MIEKPASALSTPAPRPDERCEIAPTSSRICELGTKCCVRKHSTPYQIIGLGSQPLRVINYREDVRFSLSENGKSLIIWPAATPPSEAPRLSVAGPSQDEIIRQAKSVLKQFYASEAIVISDEDIVREEHQAELEIVIFTLFAASRTTQLPQVSDAGILDRDQTSAAKAKQLDADASESAQLPSPEHLTDTDKVMGKDGNSERMSEPIGAEQWLRERYSTVQHVLKILEQCPEVQGKEACEHRCLRRLADLLEAYAAASRTETQSPEERNDVAWAIRAAEKIHELYRDSNYFRSMPKQPLIAGWAEMILNCAPIRPVLLERAAETPQSRR